MLETLNRNEAFEYQKLTPEEMKSRGILGRLVGPCADFINPTRNGRGYNESLWDNTFEDPITLEKIENKCLFGELGHPADREEVDMEKIAIALNEKPKKNKDGKLIACFDILDTPNGRILKTLCDYGTTIGISSRGTGDVITDENGEDIVDPDTYVFECFDAVIVPAVKEARLKYVTEGLDKKSENGMLKLKKALCEDLNKASAEDKKVMQETLNRLGINVEEEQETECINESCTDKSVSEESTSDKQTSGETEEANNDGSEELIKSLTESIKENAELKAEVKSLQEKLAVSDAKVSNLEAENGRNKSTIVRLTTIVKESRAKSEKISTLEEELKEKTQTIESLKKEPKKVITESVQPLNEDIAKKDEEISKLTEEVANLKKANEDVTKLTEELNKVKTDSTNKIEELSESLKRSRLVALGWKQKTIDLYESYINSRALMLGVKKEQIINRLPEQFELKDIDKACDELMTEEVNMRRLPFKVDNKAVVKVTESRKPTLKMDINDDDYVDEDSFMMAGLNK